MTAGAPPQLLALHRRLGLLAFIGAVLWPGAGIVYSVLVNLQPKPAAAAAQPLPGLDAARPPAEVLASRGIDRVAGIRIVGLRGQPFYQVDRFWAVDGTKASAPAIEDASAVSSAPAGASSREYIDARSAMPLADGDRLYAQQLAAQAIGDPVRRIASARRVAAFDLEYPRVNRILPVWRIEFAGGLRVFVDTGAGRVVTLIDDREALRNRVFGWMHRWEWLEGEHPRIRMTILFVLLASVIVSTGCGATLMLTRRVSPQPTWTLRRIHRTMGIVLVLAAHVFASSGMYHLLHFGLRGDPALRGQVSPPPIDTAGVLMLPAIDAITTRSMMLVDVAGQPAWRIEKTIAGEATTSSASPSSAADCRDRIDPGIEYVSARDGAALPGGERLYSIQFALRATGGQAAPVCVQTITRHDTEYGVLYRRLPVNRIVLADGRHVFLDARAATIAAVTTPADRSESWVFYTIHRWGWLLRWVGPIGRDIIVAMLALGILLTAVLGVTLLIRHWLANPPARPQEPPAQRVGDA